MIWSSLLTSSNNLYTAQQSPAVMAGDCLH